MRLAAVLLGASLPVLAAPEAFDVEPGHTFPVFEVEHLGISVQRGRFDRTSGSIVLDREAGTGAIDIVIDVASVSTGNGALDAVLRGEEFLDAANHPAMTFRSREVRFEAGVPRSARGDLTLAGRTRPVELRIARFACTRLPFLVRLTCGADVVARLRRSDFGISTFGSLVGEEVAIAIQVEAVRREPAAEPASAQPGG